jgi:hypothetical protein
LDTFTRNIAAYFYLRRAKDEFTPKYLKEHLSQIYKNFLLSLSKSDVLGVKELFTEKAFWNNKIKAAMEKRMLARLKEVQFESIKIIRIMPVDVQIDATSAKSRIFQVTMALAYRTTTDAAAISQLIEENVVFEYALNLHDAKWRIAGRVFESDKYLQSKK